MPQILAWAATFCSFLCLPSIFKVGRRLLGPSTGVWWEWGLGGLVRCSSQCHLLSGTVGGSGPRKEAPALIVGTQSRPADVFLPTWSRGRPAALDVTVTSPLQALIIQEASTTAGHALQVATSRKLATHLSPCRATGLDFIPFAVETLGGLFRDAADTIRAIGRQQGQRRGTSSGSIGISCRGSPSPCGGEMPISG